MCQTEIMKTAAPIRARIDMIEGFSFRFFTIILAPIATNIAAIMNHTIIHGQVSIPSGICILSLSYSWELAD
jgi:hypothetical protein